jgi:hypothetical protein
MGTFLAMSDTIVITPRVPSALVVSTARPPAGAKGDKGDKGDTGDTGISGGSFTYTQSGVSDSWIISHGLGYRPAVTVIDSGGNQVEGDVVYTDSDNLTITFSAGFSGVAYLS